MGSRQGLKLLSVVTDVESARDGGGEEGGAVFAESEELRYVLAEVPRERDFVTDFRFVFVDPSLWHVELYLAVEIFVDVLFERDIFRIPKCGSGSCSTSSAFPVPAPWSAPGHIPGAAARSSAT